MLDINKNIVELLKKGVTLSKLKGKTNLRASDLAQKINSLHFYQY